MAPRHRRSRERYGDLAWRSHCQSGLTGWPGPASGRLKGARGEAGPAQDLSAGKATWACRRASSSMTRAGSEPPREGVLCRPVLVVLPGMAIMRCQSG